MASKFFRSFYAVGTFCVALVIIEPLVACTTVSIPQSKSKVVAKNL